MRLWSRFAPGTRWPPQLLSSVPPCPVSAADVGQYDARYARTAEYLLFPKARRTLATRSSRSFLPTLFYLGIAMRIPLVSTVNSKHILSMHGLVLPTPVWGRRDATSGSAIDTVATPTPGPLQPRQQEDGLKHALQPPCDGTVMGGSWSGTCCALGFCVTLPGHGKGATSFTFVPGPGPVSPKNSFTTPPLTTTPPVPSSSVGDTDPTSTFSQDPTSSTTTSSTVRSTTVPSEEDSTRPSKSTVASHASTALPAQNLESSGKTMTYTRTETTVLRPASAGLASPVSSSATASSPSSSPTSSPGAQSHGIRPGLIAAIVPVVVVFLVLCLGACWICRRRRERRVEALTWRMRNRQHLERPVHRNIIGDTIVVLGIRGWRKCGRTSVVRFPGAKSQSERPRPRRCPLYTSPCDVDVPEPAPAPAAGREGYGAEREAEPGRACGRHRRGEHPADGSRVGALPL
ncbi:hypothetical protein OH76DRAFT_198836 [Lentinus brumalis]|uniref:Uncharacterized protein n=1 Tax=Lentinus brumalis TaxID=2498619 RepID=A0A371DI47_9APHY|nr:hypothetical protein OH76DRAFT_198836 [Polyporus brumalis]